MARLSALVLSARPGSVTLGKVTLVCGQLRTVGARQPVLEFLEEVTSQPAKASQPRIDGALAKLYGFVPYLGTFSLLWVVQI
jgi:hypothetical protein